MGEKSRGNWRVTEPQHVSLLDMKDIRIDTFRGGHYAMKLIHMPTGCIAEGVAEKGEGGIRLRERLMRELEAKVAARG